MEPEVRYHLLRPDQIVRRRTEYPIAWIPIGTLEWHGCHNPLGADTLQAEGIAVACAQQGGGLVFPPLYVGENRLESLMEANASDRDAIADGMALPPDNFTPDRFPFSAWDQTLNYHHLLRHILAEVETLGFKVGVLVAGHYPLIDHARAAVLAHNKRKYSRVNGMLAWAFVDYLLVADRYPNAGDHAAGWETSHLLALHPDAVDLSVLPDKGEPLVGVGGWMPPQDATAQFGRDTIQAAADTAIREVHDRLIHRERYIMHGDSLMEGLWKPESGLNANAADSRTESHQTNTLMDPVKDAAVRYEMLRPAQIVARRRVSPVAYIPLGTLEWHGEHLPVGADGLQADGVAVRCATLGGGLVFPTLYYGESRHESLMDSNPKYGPDIAEGMALDFANHSPDVFPFSKQTQIDAYIRLLIHVLGEAETLGFKVGVFVAGHFPLIDYARVAATMFNTQKRSRQQGLLAWAFMPYALVRDEFGSFDEHAGFLETSALKALCPDRVDMNRLPPDTAAFRGIYGDRPISDADADLGNRILDAAAVVAVREVSDRLKNRKRYVGHGCSMREGLPEND